MRNGAKHRAQSYQPSKKALRALRTIFNFLPAFIYSFVILPEDESSKVSLGHEMHLDNVFSFGTSMAEIISRFVG
jgi:hypothetical protein